MPVREGSVVSPSGSRVAWSTVILDSPEGLSAEDIPGDMTLDAAAGGKALGGERDALTLRESDETTIEAAAAENERTVVVLVGGSAAMIERWSERVASVLMLCYAGMEAGTALARLLFGETCPSGKLPFSIPTDAAHLPYFDKNVDRIEYGRYHG